MRNGGTRRTSWVQGLALVVVLLVARPAAAVCVDNYAGQAGVTCFDDLGHLLGFLDDPDRQSPEFRILQARNGQDTLMPRHNQFFNACSLYSAAPVLEHLGYARFAPGDHATMAFTYVTSNSVESYRGFDYGWHGSPEHLVGPYLHYDALYRGIRRHWSPEDGYTVTTDTDIYGCGFFTGDVCANLGGSPRTTINSGTRACNDGSTYPIFDAGEEYGLCANPGDRYDRWLNAVSTGCGGGGCSCGVDATCGFTWFLNSVVADAQQIGGCNDARAVTPLNSTDQRRARDVIKAFVDNDVPLIVAVQNGGHFGILVGYGDLDSSGRPRMGIIADPVQKVYWTSDLTRWHTADRWSLSGIFPWNQHLDGGCEDGGWAHALDGSLPASMDICRMPAGWTAECVRRSYGVELVCADRFGGVERRYHTAVEDPFVVEEGLVRCDELHVRFADDQLSVASARLRRYRYDTVDGRWEQIASASPNSTSTYELGWNQAGEETTLVWDRSWPDRGALATDDNGGRYPSYRTTIELTLDGGPNMRIEVAPPETYGVTVLCGHDGGETAYAAEARKGTLAIDDALAADRLFFTEHADRSCDSVTVRANLGYGQVPFDAEIERQYFTTARGWRKANGSAPWGPDDVRVDFDGLTGFTVEFEWDAVWRDDYWLAADGVGSGSSYGDRRTIIRLLDAAGQPLRQIEVVPY